MINIHISDLFFNSDVTSAADYYKGSFVGYNRDTLLDLAEHLLQCLEGLGVCDLPSKEALVENFLERV